MASRIYSATVASGATLSSAYVMGSVPFKKVYIEVPTMTSGTDIYIQGSSNGSTFRRVQEYGPVVKSFSASIASMATLTGSIDLEEGLVNPYLFIPSMTTGTSILIQASFDNSTFTRVMLPPGSGVAAVDFSISTFSAGVNRLVPIPAGLRYVKVELATGMTQASLTFKIIGTKANEARDFVIASNVSQRMVPVPEAFPYYKVEYSSALVDTSNSFNLICGD